MMTKQERDQAVLALAREFFPRGAESTPERPVVKLKRRRVLMFNTYPQETSPPDVTIYCGSEDDLVTLEALLGATRWDKNKLSLMFELWEPGEQHWGTAVDLPTLRTIIQLLKGDTP